MTVLTESLSLKFPFVNPAMIPIWTNDKEMISYALKSGKYLALDMKAIDDLLKGKTLKEVKKG